VPRSVRAKRAVRVGSVRGSVNKIENLPCVVRRARERVVCRVVLTTVRRRAARAMRAVWYL